MVDEPATEWVVVAHRRLPFASDTVIGRYMTQGDANSAYEHLLAHPQWFCTYSVERRVRGG